MGVGALGLYAVGRLLGTVEMAMLAAGGLVALALAVVVVHVRHPTVVARRVLHPQRLHAGVPARAEIHVVNKGPRRTPLLAVTDGFAGRREARFGVTPLRPGERAVGAYRVPTARRGVYTLGPLAVAVTDPLGLVRRTVWEGPREDATVYPRVESVAPLPPSAGHDLVGGAMRAFLQSRTGDEFHSLREYVVGDDLRRVHWKSTARTGALMIREHDVPWQMRATIVLDNHRGAQTGASFERSVEAAASVATALHARRAILRLLVTDGTEVPFGTGQDHFDALMERLAVVGVSLDDRVDGVVKRSLHERGGGALVAVTGPSGSGRATHLLAMGHGFGLGVLVRFGLGPPEPAAHGIIRIDLDDSETFATAWNRVFLRRGADTSRGPSVRGAR